MIKRIITREIAQTKKSVLLLGPRQVGKSTLISTLKPDLSINLSDEMEFMVHSSRADELARSIELESAKTIFIDEVQRLPKILNTVQSLIDKNKKLKFYLTGSSARKLKRGGANLLPGRVVNFKLGPLVAAEFNYKMETARILSRGSLPEIYLEENEKEAIHILKSYVANYLKEEIKAEALTRSLESFSRFLLETSLFNANFIDYTKLAHKSKISRHAVPRYFEILEDTLIGQRIFPFEELLEKENLIKHPKFYFFDTGVYNSLVGNFTPSLDRIGVLSEQLVFTQMLHSSWAQNIDVNISTFRTRRGIEVDFVVKLDSAVHAIEVKNSDVTGTEDCDGLIYFSKAHPECKKSYIFHMGIKERKMGPIWALPWQKGLREIGL